MGHDPLQVQSSQWVDPRGKAQFIQSLDESGLVGATTVGTPRIREPVEGLKRRGLLAQREWLERSAVPLLRELAQVSEIVPRDDLAVRAVDGAVLLTDQTLRYGMSNDGQMNALNMFRESAQAYIKHGIYNDAEEATVQSALDQLDSAKVARGPAGPTTDPAPSGDTTLQQVPAIAESDRTNIGRTNAPYDANAYNLSDTVPIPFAARNRINMMLPLNDRLTRRHGRNIYKSGGWTGRVEATSTTGEELLEKYQYPGAAGSGTRQAWLSDGNGFAVTPEVMADYRRFAQIDQDLANANTTDREWGEWDNHHVILRQGEANYFDVFEDNESWLRAGIEQLSRSVNGYGHGTIPEYIGEQTPSDAVMEARGQAGHGNPTDDYIDYVKKVFDNFGLTSGVEVDSEGRLIKKYEIDPSDARHVLAMMVAITSFETGTDVPFTTEEFMAAARASGIVPAGENRRRAPGQHGMGESLSGLDLTFNDVGDGTFAVTMNGRTHVFGTAVTEETAD